MPICTDASLTYLNKLGYNVVRHPREDIAPLDLLGRQNQTVARLGKLRSLVAFSGAADLFLQHDIPAAGLNGRTSDSLSADLGLEVLGAFIQAMGGAIGAKAAFTAVRKIQFVYSDVLCDSVEVAEVGNYLTANGVDQNNILWRQYQQGNGKLFVITDVIKSKKFSIVIESNGTGEVAVDVPVVQQMLGGKVKFSGENNGATTFTFEGPQPLVFGFKCFEIRLTDGRIALLTAPPASALAYGGVGTDPPAIQAASTSHSESMSSGSNHGGIVFANGLLEVTEA